jgi:hypothetical protein
MRTVRNKVGTSSLCRVLWASCLLESSATINETFSGIASEVLNIKDLNK